jgi:hypothetical protein
MFFNFNLWTKAKDANDWKLLINDRLLMFYWQKTHLGTPDVKAIATIGSHRAGIHRFCGVNCDEIGRRIAEMEKRAKDEQLKIYD